MLGTNGGGFFNANSAHPFENPNALTNLVQMLLIFSIGAALTNMFGRMVGNQRQGWAIFARDGRPVPRRRDASSTAAEAQGNPAFAAFGVDQTPSALQSGGNMEGKEVRFGIANSALFATVTTDASCGAVNTMHDSFTPLGGMVRMVNIRLGEIIFGGVGSGLYGMLVFAILAVFIAGLMVGRTPEYLGKKIEANEVKMAMLAISDPAAVDPRLHRDRGRCCRPGLPASRNAGPHGFTEILYAYTSATGNNGSAFAGLTANTPFYNTTLGHRDAHRPLPDDHADAGDRGLAGRQEDRARLGRHLPDPRRRCSSGSLIGVILIVGGLTFFPALSLGPIVEHFAMQAGQSY